MKLFDWNKNGKTDGADIVLTVLILALIGGAGAYFGGMAYYRDKAAPGTSICIEGQTFDIAGMTAAEAEDYLLEQLTAALTAVGRTETYTINTAAVEKVSLEGTTPEQIIAGQDPWRYAAGWTYGNTVDGSILREVDEDAVSALTADFSEAGADAHMPEDAYIEGGGCTFSIHPEEEGAALDKDRTSKAICQAIREGDNTVDLDDKGCYIEPAIRSDNDDLIADLNTIYGFFDQKITLDMTGAAETLTAEQLKSWCSYDLDAETLSVDQEQVKAYMAELAEKYNTLQTERSFTTHDGNVIKVGGGINDTYGFVLDQTETASIVTEAIKLGTDQTIVPKWKAGGVARGTVNDDIGDTYIEVSISEQHMWFYQEGKLILDTGVVTGLTSGGRSTPKGVFRVLNKMVNHTMRGSYGTAYCNYWMPLTYGGVGIHDATWRGSFGGNIYQYDGSHGCINTPLSIMDDFYGSAFKGMPVVVY